MKKLLFLAIGLTLITFMGCKEDRKVADVAGFSQNDSLQKIIAQKDNEINDIMETFNQIEAGFKEINEAENRVSLMKDGEGANRRQQLVENVQFISATMKELETLVAVVKPGSRMLTYTSMVNMIWCLVWLMPAEVKAF